MTIAELKTLKLQANGVETCEECGEEMDNHGVCNNPDCAGEISEDIDEDHLDNNTTDEDDDE